MTQETITDAIDQLKTAFLAIAVPTGFNLGNRVWAWPADREQINLKVFPFIICAQILNESGVWGMAAQDARYHTWPAGVLVCLGPFTNRDDVSAKYLASTPAWLLAGAKVLFNSQGLEGGSLRLGHTSNRFTSEVGNFGWLSAQAEFWGVYFRIPVTQFHSLIEE